MKKILIACILFNWFTCVNAQVINPGLMDTTDVKVKGKLSIEGYIDTYYGYNFNLPGSKKNPYLVSSARHDELNINLAYVSLKYSSDKVRARFIPGFGTYMDLNYAAEPGSMKNMVEANVGVCLSKRRNIWADAGVLGSPYTNESAISKDHLMYTRSLSAEYAPYYLSGVKFSIPLNKKLNSYWYLLSGWQVIRDNNNFKAIGTQLEYRPNARMLLNWNTYLGDEGDALNPGFGTRYFSDIFLVWNPSKKWNFTSSVYYGLQKKTGAAVKQSEWAQANWITRYNFNNKHSLSGRVEYFDDAHGVMIRPLTLPTVQVSLFGAGLCWNVRIDENVLFRLEGRTLLGEKNIFFNLGKPSSACHLAVASLAAWF